METKFEIRDKNWLEKRLKGWMRSTQLCRHNSSYNGRISSHLYQTGTKYQVERMTQVSSGKFCL